MSDAFDLPSPRIRKERPGRIRGHQFSGRLGIAGYGKAKQGERNFLQRSILKVAYVQNFADRSWAGHGRYLEREGAQRADRRGIGFSSELDERPVSATVEKWQSAGDALVWKLIVSPEQAHRMDLRSHTRTLMAQVAGDLGTKLDWVAIEHQNTDNAHVHVLMRGRQHNGRTLEIDPDYIKHGFRSRSQEIATRELGYRTARDHQQVLQREVSALRYTSLDAALAHHSDAAGRVKISFLPPAHAGKATYRRLQLGRLQQLRDVGLARKESSFIWRLEPGFQGLLRELQQVGDIQKRLAARAPFMNNPVTELRRFMPSQGTEISGRLIGTGLEDDLYGRRYLLLEAEGGVVHYAPQTRRVMAARDAGRLRLGDEVRLVSVRLLRPSAQGQERYSLAVERMNEPTARELTRLDEERHALQFRALFQHLLQSVEGAGARRVLATGWLETVADLGELGIEEEHTMNELENFVTPTGTRVRRVSPAEGRRHRGRLVGYATGESAERLAVIDNGQDYLAFETPRADIEPGRQVQVNAERVRDRLVWRIDDLERLQQLERDGGRSS
jgi:type IV secretory pathway VirD2 relaxase